MKILNLYAGIGGNRKNWSSQHEVTAVEINQDVAEVYRDFFPKDKVVVDDAHEYLRENFEEFDFIWASPPCPTHSKMRKHLSVTVNDSDPVYPDMKLWQEILFLRGYFEGDWVVENVKSWYDPLIRPQESGRHYFWSNFNIPKLENVNAGKDVQIRNPNVVEEQEKEYGFDLSGFGLSEKQKKKMLNNVVHPRIGQVILDNATVKQQTLTQVKTEGVSQ